MATLMLAARNSFDGAQRTLSSPSLRTWLREGWAILFSHPDDFARNDLESDRWLVVTQRAFAERGIRPLALASPKLDIERSWVTQVGDDRRTVLLEDLAQQHFGAVDLEAPALREAIERSDKRFVMIIDSSLRKQKMFTYSDLTNLPSPLEFLGWADALRAKQAEAAEANKRQAPAPHSQHFFAARRHKHHVPHIACLPAMQGRPAMQAHAR